MNNSEIELVKNDGGRIFALEFNLEALRSTPDKARFALCVKSEDVTTLIPRKIYEVSVASNGCVGVVDEQGEAAIYPSEHFLLLGMSPEVERALRNAA